MSATGPTPKPAGRKSAARRASTPDHRLYRPITTLPDDARALVGSAYEVVMLDHLVTEAMVVHLTHDGPGAFSFRFLVEDGEHHSEMIDGTGRYNSSHPLNFGTNHGFRYIQIRAESPWTIEFQHLSEMRTLANRAGASLDGEGSEVVQFATTEPTRIRVTAPESRLVSINAYGGGSVNLLNRLRGFDGRLLVPRGVVALSVHTRGSDGLLPEWQLTVG